jgi:hypothetical protein
VRDSRFKELIMAITISRYNHTARLLMSGAVDPGNLKLMLLNNSASFTAGNTTLAQVSNTGAYEVSGFGWTSGGMALAAAAFTTVGTDGVMLDANDIEVQASGGSIGPAYKAVVHDGTVPLWFIDFDGAQTAADGAFFNVILSANGLFRATNPA